MVRVKKTGLIIAAGLLSGCLAMTSPGAGKTDESASSFSSRFGFSQSEKRRIRRRTRRTDREPRRMRTRVKWKKGRAPALRM